MLSVDDVTPGMVGGDAQLVPHPPAVLPVDALAPRPKQPQMYSRARAQPGKAPELSSRTIEAASIASLSASVQSIEGRVASTARMRATSPLSRILQSQHGRSPASSRRRKLRWRVELHVERGLPWVRTERAGRAVAEVVPLARQVPAAVDARR